MRLEHGFTPPNCINHKKTRPRIPRRSPVATTTTKETTDEHGSVFICGFIFVQATQTKILASLRRIFSIVVRVPRIFFPVIRGKFLRRVFPGLSDGLREMSPRLSG